jgi:NAD(P)-dependent dehydrogenase (short-subunit alcohol dehydrogenase family)
MTNRTVLVTGTSRGIGRATALRLTSAGMSVIAGIRNREDGAQLERDAGSGLTSIVLDIGDDRSIDNAASAIAEIVGPAGLYGLVNNAAAAAPAWPMEYVTRRDLEATFRVTAFGTILLTNALLPALRRARGRIVNIGAGHLPLPLLGPGFGAKLAMEAMTDALRVELRPTGVRVVIVEPSMTRWEDPREQLASYDADLDKGLDAIPADERARYVPVVERFKALNRRMLKTATPADAVATTIHSALTTSRPKARYICGWQQRSAAFLQRATTPSIRDAVARAATGLS